LGDLKQKPVVVTTGFCFKSKEQRAKSKEQRAKSKEQSTKYKAQSTKFAFAARMTL
jgi:hypothetical protein